MSAMNVCWVRLSAMVNGCEKRQVKLEDAPHEPTRFPVVLLMVNPDRDMSVDLKGHICKHCGCVYVENK